MRNLLLAGLWDYGNCFVMVNNTLHFFSAFSVAAVDSTFHIPYSAFPHPPCLAQTIVP